MFEKKVVLLKVLIFALTQFQKTNCLFVSVGVYPNHTKYDLNLERCGHRYVADPQLVTRSANCFNKSAGNINITIIYNIPDIITPKITSRVFNGRDARVGESPWTVLLHIHFQILAGTDLILQSICTGSLITFEWVLTAAHCVSNENIIKIEVSGGSHHFRNLVDITQMFWPPSWNPINSQQNYNDIALIRLVRKYPSNLKDDIFYLLNTICLPNEAPLNENEEFGTFSGWGTINELKTLPERLQIYETEIKNNSLCDQGMLCADYIEQEPGTCVGDSGGPLFQFSDEAIPRAIEVGVLKGGEGVCKRSNRTSMWTPPMRFIPWILETIANNTLSGQ